MAGTRIEAYLSSGPRTHREITDAMGQEGISSGTVARTLSALVSFGPVRRTGSVYYLEGAKPSAMMQVTMDAHRPIPGKFTEERREQFLASLRAEGTVRRACARAGISPAAVYAHRHRNEPFARKMTAIQEELLRASATASQARQAAEEGAAEARGSEGAAAAVEDAHGPNGRLHASGVIVRIGATQAFTLAELLRVTIVALRMHRERAQAAIESLEALL